MRRLHVSLVALVLLAAGAPASATEDAITALKARDHQAIQRRLVVLSGLRTRVNAAQRLQAADRAELLDQYLSAESGLRSLDEKIQSDTTLAHVREDQQKIVIDYRIYVLVVPKTHIVIAADRLSSIGSQLSQLVPKLQAAIDRSKVNGRDVASAQDALDDMEAKIQAALDDASGAPGMVLPLEPHGYPGNRSTLVDAREKLVAAREELRAAHIDAVKVIDALT